MTQSPAAGQPAAASLERLKAQVLEAGLCVACGACVGLCPYVIFHDGQVAAPDVCGLEDGRCIDVCPQAPVPDPSQKRAGLLQALGRPQALPLGPLREVWWARALCPDQQGRVQYGGVVSTLVALALQEGLIGEAVLTQAGPEGAPEGVRARTRQEVLAAAGSIYAAGGALSALNQALAEASDHALGLVGLPCQALAAASLAAHPRHAQGARLKLVIGLFCTLNLSARGLRGVLQAAGVRGPLTRSDFPPPPAGVLEVTTAQGTTAIPLEEVRPVVLKGCALCPDLSAELADISVGAAEGRPGWNTILVRSEQGQRLLDLARAQGLLELTEMPGESRQHLSTAAANKRARAAQAWKERADG
ncbi:MAG: Coenzyme F420 hydrogenase/dehydrogenase, beta subunit C-terminal domain [Desulfarculus sp.]|nr:Coenzyme F420 hydrogenase/dehydrogenase, beta subunit C-terminal domain [Desulfarculus sp.]